MYARNLLEPIIIYAREAFLESIITITIAVAITITFVKETILGIVAVEERPYEEYTDGNVCESVDGSSVGIWRDKTADFEETAE